MSRSRRHTAICGITTARSDKTWKRLANRKFRAGTRLALAGGRLLPLVREVSDVYDAEKDGKQRFDPRAWPQGMRK